MENITKRRCVSLVGAARSHVDSALTAATSVAKVHESTDDDARLEPGVEANEDIEAEDSIPITPLVDYSLPLPPLNQLLRRALKKCGRDIAAANDSKELFFAERGLAASRIRQELARLKEFPMLEDLRKEEDALLSQGLTKRLEASATRKFLEKYKKAQVHLSMFAKCLADD
jgi:hypothetical protein